jgi:two-component system sensor histidine kinase KdpD
LTAKATDAAAVIELVDNGPGLPIGDEAKVFDKFFRGSLPTPDGRRGVGLGLAICRAIVEAHGGKIAAANRAGGGAAFRITLPREGLGPIVPAETYGAEAIA